VGALRHGDRRADSRRAEGRVEPGIHARGERRRAQPREKSAESARTVGVADDTSPEPTNPITRRSSTGQRAGSDPGAGSRWKHRRTGVDSGGSCRGGFRRRQSPELMRGLTRSTRCRRVHRNLVFPRWWARRSMVPCCLFARLATRRLRPTCRRLPVAELSSSLDNAAPSPRGVAHQER
jgi:hypothetical protein